MRRLRHRLLQRLVAACLVAGVGAGVVPSPARAEVPQHAGAHGLNAHALAAARQAARLAPTRDAAIDTFVAVYVRVSGDGLATDALYDALRGDAFSCVPPPVPPAAVASAGAQSVPPALGAALVPVAERAERLPCVRAPQPDDAAAGALAPAPRATRVRAP